MWELKLERKYLNRTYIIFNGKKERLYMYAQKNIIFYADD